MDSFGFTRKKFLSLSDTGRYTHVVAWLSRIYQTMAGGRQTFKGLLAFHAQYKAICTWIDLPCALPPKTEDTRAWLVYISDAIHRHRTAAGQGVKDYDLLERVTTQDRVQLCQNRPDMDYEVALDGLRSLFNIGSIFRTCEAAGVSGLILGNCPGKESRQVQKTAMGAHQSVDEEKTQDLAGLLLEKKKKGFQIIGAETVQGSVPCHEYDWPAKAVIVMGNEEYGISPHVLSVIDDPVHIPMFGKKNSLNVANALSAILFQAVFSCMNKAL
ncbi:MAG: hypothetical protein HUK40_07055 [Desulfobacter sp.]|nr:hypothetical protein [Desulfobacter sp.]WDP85017.1 MAG: hypothetical protein HUN05_07595 [Desulfobacter sp.]